MEFDGAVTFTFAGIDGSDMMLDCADALSWISPGVVVVASALDRVRVPKPAPRATPLATASFQLSLGVRLEVMVGILLFDVFVIPRLVAQRESHLNDV